MFLDNFEIEKVPKKRSRYEVEFKMEFGDSDYAWKKIKGPKKDDYFWLLVSYLNTHGAHWKQDEFLSEFNREINSHLYPDLIDRDLLMWNTYGSAHSFIEFKVFYYDENDIKHNVKIPNIDEVFPCKEWFKKALLSAREAKIKELLK